jgi:hypothetical protein
LKPFAGVIVTVVFAGEPEDAFPLTGLTAI